MNNIQKLIDEQVSELIEQAHRELSPFEAKPTVMDDLALHYAKQGVGVSLPLQADIYFVELEDYHKAVVSLRKEMDYSEGLLRRLEAREKVVTRMLFGLTVSLIAVFALSATLYLSR